MSTFNHLELEYLIAAVSSKFQAQRDRPANSHWVNDALEKVETEVVRVIREWARDEQPTGSGKQ